MVSGLQKEYLSVHPEEVEEVLATGVTGVRLVWQSLI
jgi:hypothetical protein